MKTDIKYVDPTGISFSPLRYDEEKCIGCNRCVDVCQVDIIMPSSKEGTTPFVAYPGECWYCGCCVMACPVDGALTLKHPLMNQVRWVEKASLTGENTLADIED